MENADKAQAYFVSDICKVICRSKLGIIFAWLICYKIQKGRGWETVFLKTLYYQNTSLLLSYINQELDIRYIQLAHLFSSSKMYGFYAFYTIMFKTKSYEIIFHIRVWR